MTLVLSMHTDDFIVQVSERRLTTPISSSVLTDETDKTASLTIPAGRYIIGIAGLAKAGCFSTADWLIEQCIALSSNQALSNEASLENVAEFIRDGITKIYNTQQELRSVEHGKDALHILITGFNKAGAAQYALVTNRAAMDLRGKALARRQFGISSGPFPSTRVILLGDHPSVASSDSTRLSELARENSPPEALIAKAIETIRSAANASKKIGQQISSTILSRDSAKSLRTAYHSKTASSVVFLPAQVSQIKGNTTAIKGGWITGAPHRARPAKNAPCHCGSGKKYKQCHKREDDAAGEWTIEITDFIPSEA